MEENLLETNTKLHETNRKAAHDARMKALKDALAAIISKDAAAGRQSSIIHDNHKVGYLYDMRWNDCTGHGEQTKTINNTEGLIDLMASLSTDIILWLSEQGITRIDLYDETGAGSSTILHTGRAVSGKDDILKHAGPESAIILSWEDQPDEGIIP